MSATQEITINYQPCESSQVAAWGYHAESKTFGVKYHGKPGDRPSIYHYFDVPQSLADNAARAESMGRFVNTALKGGKFRYERQPDEPGGIVEVMCFNFPDGATYWAERAGLDAEAVVQQWKDLLTPERRAAYIDSGAHGGFCIVRMPRADYRRIPATSQSAALFA
jgi:hypothetical protein